MRITTRSIPFAACAAWAASCGGDSASDGDGGGTADESGSASAPTVGSMSESVDDGPDTGPDTADSTATDGGTDTDTCGGEGIIPAERRVDWTFAGVPGGIPHRETTCATIEFSADVTDFAPVIQAAIDACPSEQVVLIGEGAFPIGSPILLDATPQSITVRGMGPEITRLVPSGTTVFTLGVDASSPVDVAIVGGTEKGSDRIELASVPAEITADIVVMIDRANDPELVHAVSDPDARRMTQLAMVTAVEGNELVVEPPLAFDFSDEPHLTRFAPFARFQGIEDLSIDSAGSTGGRTFFFDGCYGCWLRNIANHVPPTYHLVGANTLRCEVRDSLFDDSQTYGPDNGGVVLYGNNTGWKVENNIFFRTFPGVELNISSSANVIAYNYATDVRGGTDWNMATCDFNDNHAPHDFMNLYEGNIGVMFMADGYFGSSSHGTLFRNNFGAPHPTYPTGNRQAVSLKRWAYYYNVVGNVLGAADWPADGEYQIDVEYGYEIATIYQLGFPNIGNNSLMPADGASPPGIDAHVEETLLRHGNYDYDNADTIWDPAICETTIPSSVVYTSAPAWWPDATPWPPIGPDVDGLVVELPAQARAHDLGLP
jgi:hypothetical protein